MYSQNNVKWNAADEGRGEGTQTVSMEGHRRDWWKLIWLCFPSESTLKGLPWALAPVAEGAVPLAWLSEYEVKQETLWEEGGTGCLKILCVLQMQSPPEPHLSGLLLHFADWLNLPVKPKTPDSHMHTLWLALLLKMDPSRWGWFGLHSPASLK